MLDCTKKDRHNAAQGVAAGKSKLVPEQVYEIRRRYDAGEGSFKIAKDFGIILTQRDAQAPNFSDPVRIFSQWELGSVGRDR